MIRRLAAALVLALLAGAAGAAPAPRMGITSFAQLRTPLPYPVSYTHLTLPTIYSV